MLPYRCVSVSIVRISVFVCLLKSQLGISETELRDLLSEREKKVEEIQQSLEEIQVLYIDIHIIITPGTLSLN